MNTPLPLGPELGLKTGEAASVSIPGLIRALLARDSQEVARYRVLSDAVAGFTQQVARHPQSFLLPGEMLGGRRDMTVAGVSGSQYLVGTQTIDYVRPYLKRSVVARLGVQRHNQVENATIVRESAPHTITWLDSEDDQIGDGQTTFGQASMLPRSVAVTVIMSRKHATQQGDAGRAFVENGLLAAIGEAVDAAFVNGSSGSGQPAGVLTLPGVDSRAGTTFALSDAAAMLKVCDGYATESIVWLAGVNAAEVVRKREKASGNGYLLDGGRMLDYPVLVSRAVPDAALVVADWSKSHVASWGAVELMVDPYTYFNDGRVMLRALLHLDFAHDAPAQIAVATALT